MTKKSELSDCLVILGIGSDDKPHAARFKVADEPVVRKAAELMGMRFGRATGEQTLRVATRLTSGKLFATGKALVPLVKTGTFEELLKVLTLEPATTSETAALATPDRPTEAAAASAEASGPVPSDLWADIKVGSVVLCRDDSDEPAWWECVVVSVGRDPETLLVRWRDWPRLKAFSAKRHAVALIGPATVQQPA